MTQYNGHDLHHYTNHTELHLNPPAFKIGQQVKLTTKGKEVQASRGQLFGLEDTFFVTTMTVSTLVYMGRKEADSDIQSSGWHYGINRMAGDEGAGWDKSVEADHIEAVDQGGRFTLGVVMEDTVDAGNSVLEELTHFLEEWIDCDPNLKFETEDKPKVLIAYWHDTVGATPNNEIAALDGDLAGLVDTIEYSWLAGSALTDEQIADVKRDLMGGVGADIPTPPDAIGALAQITIDTYDFDDPDIQYLYEED